ncbi:MAG UNVERIFIED_CONTAM: hypothetical protein LVR29_06135 [Microcystis novacekii LVE1205-3]
MNKNFFIEVQSASTNELEKLTALIAGSILTYHDQLIEAYNQIPPTKQNIMPASLGILAQLRQIQFLAEIQPGYIFNENEAEVFSNWSAESNTSN